MHIVPVRRRMIWTASVHGVAAVSTVMELWSPISVPTRAGYVLIPMYTRKPITAATTRLRMRGTVKVCRFSSSAVISIWTRYTSSGESGSTNVFKASGTFVNGGIGPEDAELGVEAPDDVGVLPRPERRDDFAMVGDGMYVFPQIAGYYMS